MSKHTTLLAALVALLWAGASPAAAKIIEVGQPAQAVTPSCPTTPCFAVPRTTGYQAKADGVRGLFAVPADGRVVAWSITLSKPGAKQVADFEKQFGGPASAGIAILKPAEKLYARTVSASPIRKLSDYFGETVQFPLETSIPVKKGMVVGLTVPTWAPALAVGFGNDVSWRAASRDKGDCNELSTQTPQRSGTTARYRCLFRTARLTYTATLITSPPKKAKKKKKN
ncbi:MAG TPA: hypothetical protein VF533_24845 [Solirubrobacteraceae bacterium]